MREDALTVHVPMTFRRRGGRKLIVAPDGSAMPAVPPRFNVDNVLVKALARAFRWRKLLEAATYGTIEELAAAEKINHRSTWQVGPHKPVELPLVVLLP